MKNPSKISYNGSQVVDEEIETKIIKIAKF